MYKFIFRNVNNTSQIEELIKEFLQPFEYEVLDADSAESGEGVPVYSADDYEDVREGLKRAVYRDLSELTGKRPRWGILTGIRPVKLAGEIGDRGENPARVLRDRYLLDESKTGLTCDILEYQRRVIGRPENDSLSMYIGIPFCPTRCLYCSFTSNQVPDSEIERYLEALNREIDYCTGAVKDSGYKLESIYFGGGTPTTLNPAQLDDLLGRVSRGFELDNIREFTVEAGRPDTITGDKLRVLKEHGVDRISINPQTMKQETLDLIGRRHTVDDVRKAFELAHAVGFEIINTDLIAGLPEESFEDFKDSLKQVMDLGATNITLHTLAVKRASRLKEMDENFNYRDEELREQMLDYAHGTLADAGFRPYYLYRQKHTSGNTENTGFCLNDSVSTYNIRIMEEAQSILALGAGGISKIYFPEENRLERVANVSNYEIYIERIDEMIQRKINGFFGGMTC